jgi:hypothetical protein
MDGRSLLLAHARRLIATGWTQHADARASDDTAVHPWDNRAIRWSLLGALVAAVEYTAANRGEPAALRDLAGTCILLAETVDADSLQHWNDTPDRTIGDVLTALDHTIELTRVDDDQDADEPFPHSPD